MASNNCPQCGAPANPGAASCKYCGEPLATAALPVNPAQAGYPMMQNGQQGQPMYAIPQNQIVIMQSNPIDPNWPVKSKVAAGLFGIFLGTLGVHKFYMGKPGFGIIYLLLCWAYIPTIAGIVEGIIYLTQSDYDFQVKNHVRLK